MAGDEEGPKLKGVLGYGAMKREHLAQKIEALEDATAALNQAISDIMHDAPDVEVGVVLVELDAVMRKVIHISTTVRAKIGGNG